MAGGGIKKADESNCKSLDNTLTYQWAGNNGDDLTNADKGGNDYLDGGLGNDLIQRGLGSDILYGRGSIML